MSRKRKKLRQVPCPFYAMVGIMGAFVPQKEGEVCGFKFNGKVAFCSMAKPNWDTCEHNRPQNQETIAKIMNNFVIVPGNKLIREKFRQVMGREYS